MDTIVAVIMVLCTQSGECSRFELEVNGKHDSVKELCAQVKKAHENSAKGSDVTIKEFECFRKVVDLGNTNVTPYFAKH